MASTRRCTDRSSRRWWCAATVRTRSRRDLPPSSRAGTSAARKHGFAASGLASCAGARALQAGAEPALGVDGPAQPIRSARSAKPSRNAARTRSCIGIVVTRHDAGLKAIRPDGTRAKLRATSGNRGPSGSARRRASCARHPALRRPMGDGQATRCGDDHGRARAAALPRRAGHPTRQLGPIPVGHDDAPIGRLQRFPTALPMLGTGAAESRQDQYRRHGVRAVYQVTSFAEAPRGPDARRGGRRVRQAFSAFRSSSRAAAPSNSASVARIAADVPTT